MDAMLDAAGSGPVWLRVPDIADEVARAILFAEGDLQLYRRLAWVVMTNHVHLLIEPLAPLARITKTLKGFTARKCNLLLGRRNVPFWQEESYDHWARNEGEVQRITAYIEGNPVTAGLVAKPEDWRWSSANPDTPWR